MRTTGAFEVYLTEEAATAVDGDPLVAEAVDFHDSGVWITHAEGRDFFPYDRVVCIREGGDDGRETAATDAGERDAGSEGGTTTDVGERRDAAGGTAEPVDGLDPNGE